MSRTVTARYTDPLEVVWVETARRLGMRLVRSGEVYASWDGAGTLTLSTPDAFDADDLLYAKDREGPGAAGEKGQTRVRA